MSNSRHRLQRQIRVITAPCSLQLQLFFFSYLFLIFHMLSKRRSCPFKLVTCLLKRSTSLFKPSTC